MITYLSLIVCVAIHGCDSSALQSSIASENRILRIQYVDTTFFFSHTLIIAVDSSGSKVLIVTKKGSYSAVDSTSQLTERIFLGKETPLQLLQIRSDERLIPRFRNYSVVYPNYEGVIWIAGGHFVDNAGENISLFTSPQLDGKRISIEP
jgi:hypothetical protein